MPLRPSSQLTFDLHLPRLHGGARRDAGRKEGPNPRQRHRSRAPFARPFPAHVTLRLVPGLISLRTIPLVEEIQRTFVRGCERSSFRLVHYSLQGNHAHVIVEADDPEALGRGMMAVASRLARAVNRIMQRTGRVLADRYDLHLLRTPREVHRALRYVLLNARRHARHAVGTLRRAVRVDPASSGRWFDGWSRATRAADDSASRQRPAAVARARTWLVTVGWRRHGLIDPADVPGPASRSR